MGGMRVYPLKSVPVFKQRIWGGRRLAEVFGKELPPDQKIGESWEIADLPEGQSTIGNGPLRGTDAGRGRPPAYRRDYRGTGLPASSFPLLVKFLDAQDVLSVQVHPDPETCRRMGKGQPKTECWYVIQAEPGAVIYKGFKKGVTRERFARAIRGWDRGGFARCRGGAARGVSLPAGRDCPRLGAGLLIAEVQTPSDTTYRVFDWNRVDDTGKPRQLHIAEALESIHFDVTPDKLPVTTVGRLVDCEYFKVDKGGGAVPTISSRPGTSAGTAHPVSVTLAPGCMRVLIVITGGGVICLERGRAGGVQGGRLSADPRRIRGGGAIHCRQ